MRKDSGIYAVLFAGAVCAVCAVLVSVSAVTLKPRQEVNRRIDMQRNVMLAAGLIGADTTAEEVSALFAERIRSEVIVLETGATSVDIDPDTYDQRRAEADPQTSTVAPPNAAQVCCLPKHAMVFKVNAGSNGTEEKLVLPIHGKGLWSTLYGFIALDGSDLNTILGIAFYEHKETPGLGGEVDNPDWRAKWVGRRAFDKSFSPIITVIKGTAGSPQESPYQVDGLSGATMTSRGVSALVQFWLGENGFGPYLRRLREEGGR